MTFYIGEQIIVIIKPELTEVINHSPRIQKALGPASYEENRASFIVQCSNYPKEIVTQFVGRPLSGKPWHAWGDQSALS